MAKSAEHGFIREIRDAFVSNQANQFLLTGNVQDVYRIPDDAGDDRYVSLNACLGARFARSDRLIVNYNIARGIEFCDEEDRRRALELFLRLFAVKEHALGRESFNEVMTRSSAYILPSLVLLRKLCKAAALERQTPVAIIVEHTESLLPDIPMRQMSPLERQRLVFFKEWLTEPDFVDSPHLLILISETVSAVSGSLRGLPFLVNVNLPLPEERERLAFLRWSLKQQKRKPKLRGSQTMFAQLSAGLTLLGIEQTIRMATYRKGAVERSDFMDYLNRLLVSRIGDYIEIQRPGHTFDDVIGCGTLKRQLARVRKTLATNNPEIAPVGLLVAGPNGVGKTYVMTAWAKECERIVIVLKNLRSSFFGETDQIFEKIRQVLEVLGNVIIIVDEADTVFAKPGSGTHETEARLFGNVIKMMGDPRNRGRIVWVMMTARPGNLAPDLKRSGRCGLHLPIFDPEGDDRRAFIDFVLKRCGLKLAAFEPAERDDFLARTAHLSPADFRELAVELQTEAEIGDQPLTAGGVLTLLDDFVGGSSVKQRRLQTLYALQHCSRRSLMPPVLRALTPENIAAEINDLEREAS